MHHGEICGRHFASGQPLRVKWNDGLVTEVGPATGDAGGVWLAPTLFDLQINGYGGVDFQRDDHLTEEKLLSAARQMRRDGCGRFFFTLITDEWPKLMARVRQAKAVRDANPELRAALAGWHIEGPFLSPEVGFKGAHNPAVMRDATEADLRELRAVTGSDPVLLTLAPERGGSLEAIRCALSLGIVVSLGHTNASADTIRAAVAAGARGFTHLGNGIPQQLDRHDNILWRVFDTPGLMPSLIPDTHHVSPILFRHMHRALPPERIYYTTDAMSAAGAPPGRYTIGTIELEVGADQIVRQPGKPNFAGSALKPVDGITRAAQMLGKSWREVWPHFSQRPAELMGLRNEIAAGQPADFCMVKEDQAGTLVSARIP
ncbi:MAG: N-acetylglucosamine-6-phosphate deacetylase [Limisphaerales bacterium]|nr:MAG: N-acetylglucosamine-6-phosphate deacetylase [Limisphaerales bacterium]KAG0509884.1 MAG: N-acetylglucosamine-6-phosphate deacetylase [Limisphaerales bacterium]TXT50645.1 MAG: N-acetylglucosamine-6-phosphate deacetylase [Limisphaerales bacterium]